MNARYLLALLLWCLVAPVSAATGPGAEVESRIAEPVFRGEVYYAVSGPAEAPTVVLVHGLGDKAARDWDGLVADLSRDYRVVRFDLPGFGRSTRGNYAYTPDRYAEFLRYLVDRHIGARPFYLVGHSMGGAIALRYAAQNPQDVKALVLADVPAILHRFSYSKHLVAFGLSRMVPGLYLDRNGSLDNLLGRLLGRVEKTRVPAELVVQQPLLRQRILKGDPFKIAALALALEDFSRDIATVQAPTLLLWGDRDEIAPLRNGRVLAANMARARLDVLEGSGHTPMDDVPERFQVEVREFLRNPTIEPRQSLLNDDSPLPESSRQGSCDGKSGQIFEGDYDRIVITRCEGAVLRHVRARHLRIRGSSVTVEDSRIGDRTGGLTASASRVVITSSRIEGKTAILLNDSHLDVAGSRIVGQDAAVAARSGSVESDAVFSVSRVESRNHYGPLHGWWSITPDTPL